jgi:hypothetical protein
MADGPNSDEIRQITEHPYFQTLLREQVRERVNAQWDQTRKVLAPALAVLLAAASFYGYTSINGLNEKKKELETNVDKKIAELNEAIKQAIVQSNNVDAQARASSEKAQAVTTQIGFSKDLATSILDQLKFTTSQTVVSIQRTHDELKTEIAAFDTKQTTAAAQARDLMAKLDAEDEKAQELARKEQDLTDTVRRAGSEVDKADKIRGVLESEQARFQRTNSDLLKATQAQYVLIHSGSERQVTVYAAAKPGGKSEADLGSALQKYELKITTGSVRAGKNVRISVLAGADGRAGSESDYPLDEGVRSPIKGVPFDYEVQFIYHATILTHHFAVIRVVPHEGVSGE